MDALDPWGVGKSVNFHLVHLDSFDSSWPNLLLGLVKPNFINWTTHCLTYYSRKQSLNNGPILLLFYCSLRHLFKSSHLLWPMWRVWEAHVGLDHLEWSWIGSFWARSLLLGLLMGLGLKVHVGHVLGLKHDLGLGVDPNYKPCWDHIRFHLLITCFSTFTPTGVAALTMPQPPQLKFDVTTTTIIISVWFFHVLVFATLS